MGKWVDLDDTNRGWRFYCSVCGGHVYWPQSTRGHRLPKKCPFPTCPWCQEKMEADDGKENEN